MVADPHLELFRHMQATPHHTADIQTIETASQLNRKPSLTMAKPHFFSPPSTKARPPSCKAKIKKLTTYKSTLGHNCQHSHRHQPFFCHNSHHNSLLIDTSLLMVRPLFLTNNFGQEIVSIIILSTCYTIVTAMNITSNRKQYLFIGISHRIARKFP